MAKEFKKQLVHPTRRKLMDMVKTGEYEKNSHVGWTKTEEQREVGDVWEDEFYKYERKSGYTLKTPKNHKELQEIRNYLSDLKKCKNPNCKKVRKTKNDEKLILKTGYCIDCNVEVEHKFRVNNLLTEYENYKIFTRMIIEGKIKIEEMRQSILDLKPYYEFVNSDGTTERWNLPKPVDEVKQDIEEMILNGEDEINKISDARLKLFELFKEHKLEHLV